MAAFLHGLADRNSAIRKSYALALGHLVKVSSFVLQIFTISITCIMRSYLGNMLCEVKVQESLEKYVSSIGCLDITKIMLKEAFNSNQSI